MTHAGDAAGVRFLRGHRPKESHVQPDLTFADDVFASLHAEIRARFCAAQWHAEQGQLRRAYAELTQMTIAILRAKQRLLPPSNVRHHQGAA
jgi:hypothetical protein